MSSCASAFLRSSTSLFSRNVVRNSNILRVQQHYPYSRRSWQQGGVGVVGSGRWLTATTTTTTTTRTTTTRTRTIALSDSERESAVSKLSSSSSGGGGSNPNSWEDQTTCLVKQFHFSDFSQAWAFLSRTALLAEKMDHHPEWSNVYNVVDVKLTTHECQGVSHKDIAMAEAMDEYARSIMQSRG